jgi:hypothetical protein
MAREHQPTAPPPGPAADTEAQRRGHSPHDGGDPEPLGPLTPDDSSPLGDTPEVHDEAIKEDFPPGHPGREAAGRLASGDGSTRGNVRSPLPGWLRRMVQRRPDIGRQAG